jgi:hypothetical protein
MEWWHLIWERLGDAAFVQAVKPHAELEAWVRDAVLGICRRPADDWIGPWFRKRTEPLEGMLETAHITAAVASAMDLCPELFSDEEQEEIRAAVRDKGMEPCRRSAAKYAGNRNHINNWFMVLLNGFGTAAVMLDDREAVREAVSYYSLATSLYNQDSYGESLQYSNYASIHLVHLRELLIRYDPALEAELDPGCFTRLMPWYAASLLYIKPLSGWGREGDAYPRSVNFGDSSAMFRPSADVLLHAAARSAKEYPTEAGLARWLFDATYANPRLGPTDSATFGFVNSYQFPSLLLYKEAVAAVSPEQANLPLLSQFETGTVTARNSWTDPVTVLAVQGGFLQHNVSSHRHLDQNSFMLTHKQERFFVDPGHCCYRLHANQVSKLSSSHNTWSFLAQTEDEAATSLIEQKEVYGNIHNANPFFNHSRILRQMDDVQIIRSDCAGVYGAPILKAERTWIAVLPHILFVVDRIESAAPVKVQSHFVVNNRDNRLNVNVAASNKLVFRRGGAGMKFFLLSSQSEEQANPCRLIRDWGYVHDSYHPQPNQQGQGKEGSGLIFRYESEGFRHSHTLVYGMAMDSNEGVRKWHMKVLEDGSYLIEPPSKTGGVSLKLTDEGHWLLHNLDNSRTYRIDEHQAERVTL